MIVFVIVSTNAFMLSTLMQIQVRSLVEFSSVNKPAAAAAAKKPQSMPSLNSELTLSSHPSTSLSSTAMSHSPSSVWPAGAPRPRILPAKVLTGWMLLDEIEEAEPDPDGHHKSATIQPRYLGR